MKAAAADSLLAKAGRTTAAPGDKGAKNAFISTHGQTPRPLREVLAQNAQRQQAFQLKSGDPQSIAAWNAAQSGTQFIDPQGKVITKP